MKIFRYAILLFAVFCLAFIFSGSLSFWRMTTPSPANNQAAEEPAKTDWLTKADRLIFLRQAAKTAVSKHVAKEYYVTSDNIPDNLKQAVVAVEDSRFYEHHGIDFTGIVRASLVNLQSGQIEEGASTITQQLVKNLFLTSDQTFSRKAEEVLLALDFELRYSKDEILELYLNTIYFGSDFYGIRQASRGYFGKEPKELELPESTMLAGLPNAPSLYSPYVDFMLAKKRQFIVIDAMQNNGYISKDIAESAKIQPLYLAQEK